MSRAKRAKCAKQFPRDGFLPRRRVILAMCLAAAVLFVWQRKTLGVTSTLFGDTAIESGQDSNASGSAEAFQVTASGTGTLGSLAVYLDSASRARQVFVGLYSNAGGNPGVLLAQGSSTTPQAGAWNTVTVPATNVTSGTVYWIAILGTGGTLYFRDSNAGGCSSMNSAQSNLTTLPSSWSAGPRWPSCRVSAYGVPGTASQPILSLSPTTITFNGTQGGANPNAVQVAVSNTGGGTLSFTDSTDSAWLSVSPSSGTAPQNLSVSATLSGLAAGTYTGHVTVTATGAQGSPGTVTVTLVVSAPAPPPAPTVSSLSPSSATAGGAGFTLTVTGTNYVSGDSVLWNGSALTTTFASATQLTAAVPASLIASPGSAAVSVQAPGGTSSNSASFSISAPNPQLSVSPTTLSFSGTQGSSTNPSPASVSVTNSGGGSLTFTASSDSPWLSVSPASGTAPQTLQVSAAVGTLTAGTYTGHVTVTASGAQNSPASVTVTFTVAADAPPVISGVAASSITSSGAAIAWTTDKASSSQVNYGTTTAYGSSSTLDATLVTSHNVTLSGLTAGTVYHYQVQSADSIGTMGTSGDFTFTTSGSGAYSCPCSIWSSTTTPGTPSVNDSQAVELGVKFTADVSGYITGIRFYKGSMNTGTHTGTLWTTSGTQLATATFSGESASGWQQVNFGSPVAIAANTTYVASYHTTVGFYAGDNQFFASSAVNQPPLHALANGTSGGNGVYVYGAGGVFPGNTYQSSNYWVDVVFNTTQTPPVTYGIAGTISGGSNSTVTLSGAASATTTADGSGNFSFSGLVNGSYTVTPSKAGFTMSPSSQTATINGANVTGINFTASAQTFSISGTISPTAGGAGATVTLSGAAAATTTASSSGTYSFTGLANGSYAVTPNNTGYSFNPTSQAATVSGANVSGINFTAVAQAPTFTISGTISPATLGSGAVVTLSGAAGASTTANASGNYSFAGLANGSYTVTPSSGTATFSPTSAAVTVSSGNVSGVNFTATGSANVLFFDDFTGTSLSSDWTIIQRHGEYEQSETECNTAGAVSVAGSTLTITTSVGPATCGDFNTDGSVRHAPQSWPYISGDVQWTNLNFTYGTVEVRAQFPPQSAGVWPAIWMLGANCQVTNIFTADTGYSTCPVPGESGYQEIDTVECDPGGPWCHFLAYNGSVNPETAICNFSVDANWHVFTMVWAANSLSLSMDGTALPGCSVTGNAVPSNPMFLLLQTQTATGSPFGPPNDAQLPTTFNIDYVKVTQP